MACDANVPRIEGSSSACEEQKSTSQGDFETNCTSTVHSCGCHVSAYPTKSSTWGSLRSAHQLPLKPYFYAGELVRSRPSEDRAFRPPIC